MNAIILAAGTGRRMAPMGWRKPKCLLPCPDGLLLEHTLRSVAAAGITESIIVTGYESDLVESVARNAHGHVAFLRNSAFAETNTLHSAFLARDHMADGFILLNADVWFDAAVISSLCTVAPPSADAAESVLVVQKRICGEEEVKIVLDSQNRVQRIGKDIPPHQAQGEYIGIGRFHPSVVSDLIAAMSSLLQSPGGKSLFVEAAINAVLAPHPHRALFIAEDQAIEIDTPDDHALAEKIWVRKPTGR